MQALDRYAGLVVTLIARDLKVRYRRSAVGFVWTMLHPLLMMLVLFVVFSQIFRSDVSNFAVYALTGILFWNFFSQGVIASMNSLRGNATLLTKVPVAKAVFPVAAVLSGLMNLLFAIVPLLAIMAGTRHPFTAALSFVPVAIAVAAIFTLGLGLLLAPLAVRFSDTVEFVSILLTLGVYLTPVFYPVSIIPERWQWIVRSNPLTTALELFRAPIYEGTLPPFQHVAIAIAVAVAVLAAGATAFRLAEDRLGPYL